MTRRNHWDIVSNPQENSPIIDEVPLEDPTSDETTQTQTNNILIAVNCNTRNIITRSGKCLMKVICIELPEGEM